MTKIRKPSFLLLCLVGGGGLLSAIAQTDMAPLAKEIALMVPLQIAAFGYVAWYWAQRRRDP